MEDKSLLMVAHMVLPKEVFDHFVITGIKGNAPYFTKLIGFNNDDVLGHKVSDPLCALLDERC